MNPQVAAVKSEFEDTSGRLLKNLEATPDDKLDWSPAPSARTPLDIAFHSAMVIGLLHGAIEGSEPMQSLSPEQIDAFCRQMEQTHGTRDEVAKQFKEKSSAYIAWLDGLTEEKLAETWRSPFGDIPISAAISLPTYHTAGHIAQLEYIQTIYGDRTWH